MQDIEGARYDDKNKQLIFDIEQLDIERSLVVSENIRVDICKDGNVVSIRLLNVSEAEASEWFNDDTRLESFKK